MADELPPIVAVLAGSIAGFKASLAEARSDMGATAVAAEGAGKGMRAGLDDQGAAATAAERFAGVGDAVERHGKTVAKVGAVMTTVGAVFTVAGAKLDDAHRTLRRTIENSGLSYDDYEGRIDAAVKTQARFGHSSAEVQQVLTGLTLKFKDPAKGLDALGLAADIAAAKNISLGDAATVVSKAMSGNAKTLKAFGIEVDSAKKATALATAAATEHAGAQDTLATATQNLADVQAVLAGKAELSVGEQIRLRDAHAAVAMASAELATTTTKLAGAQAFAEKAAGSQGRAMDELRKKVGGMANEEASTLLGRLEGMKTGLGNVAAELGSRFGPAFTLASGAVTTASTVAGHYSAITEALGPVIARVAASVSAGSLSMVASHLATAAAAVASAATAAAAWLLAAAPFIAVGVAVAAVAYLIVRNWDSIAGFFVAVWDGITAGIAAVIGWFTRLPGAVIGALAGAGRWLVGVGGDIVGGLAGGLAAGAGAVLRFFTGLPRRMWDAFGNVSEWAGTMARNIVIGLWNGLVGMGDWLFDRVWGWIKSVIPGPVKLALGIASPSKVMAGLGAEVARGLAAGMLAGTDAVASAAGALAGAAQAPLGGTGTPGPGFAGPGFGLAGAGGSGPTLPVVAGDIVLQLDGATIARVTREHLLRLSRSTPLALA